MDRIVCRFSPRPVKPSRAMKQIAIPMFAILAAAAVAQVTPEAHGAKGDGKANDTAAFKQAMAALKSGGTLKLAAGKTYVVDGPLRIGSGVTVTGDETKNPVLRLSAGAGSYGVFIDRADKVAISGVRFEAAKNDLGTIVMIAGSKNVTLNDNKFFNSEKAQSAFVRIKDSIGIKVSESEFANGYEAVHIYGVCKDIEVAYNNIHGVDQYGIRVQGTAETQSSDIRILRNTVKDMNRPKGQTAGHPVYVHIGEGVGTNRHKNIDVIGNKLYGNNKAFASGGNGDLIEYCDVDNGSVSQNITEGGGDVGVGIVRSSGILVQGNSAGYNNTNGIAIWESSNCRVIDNKVYNNNQDRDRQWGSKYFKGGIRIMARTGFSDDNEITGNKSWDDQVNKTQDYGIYLMKGARRTKLGKNELNGNRFGAIRDESTVSNEQPNLLGKKVRRLVVFF